MDSFQTRPAPAASPGTGEEPVPLHGRPAASEAQWLRLGYACIAVTLLARLAYIASGTIELSEDEAYQWLWSKHLALSYYSKPPLIAYSHFLSTAIWGDTAFGVRFFSPVITALMSLVLLRFFAREVNARAGVFLVLIATAAPLLSLGAVLMTVDPLSVLFWTAAMLAGWRAIQPKATTKAWLWVGVWMGLGFLSKYTELVQLLCWVVLFALWRPARAQLRRPGPYLALLLNVLCILPVVIWNAQRSWVTVHHVADDAGANQVWHPTLRFFAEFVGMEFGLMNPVFFVATLWAAIAFWRRGRQNLQLIYFFSMGAPLFLLYTLQSFRAGIQPNWIAPAVIPLFCLMVVYWDHRLRQGQTKTKGWLAAGLGLGFAAVLVLHNTDVWQVTQPVRRALAGLIPSRQEAFIAKFTGQYLPVNLDPLHRVRTWSDVAREAGQARRELEAEGKPVFIIAEAYQMASEITFYLPEARVRVSDTPLVYFRSTARPENQFYFWPGYQQRKGENALYVREVDRVTLKATPPPKRLLAEFESVTDLGVHPLLYHGQPCRPLQLFACRGLK